MVTKRDLSQQEHVLKCHAPYFDAVKLGLKSFEVRRNDRFFQQGDTIILTRMKNTKTGWREDTQTPPLKFVAGPILQGGQFGIEPGYCAFSLFRTKEWEDRPHD